MTTAEPLTTVLQDIRTLLAAHGEAPAPWSPPDQVVEGLCRVLRSRTGDDGLWRDLEALAARVEARQMDARASRDREVLSPGTTESLLADLRVALRRGDGDDRSLRGRVLAAIGGPGLAALLMLGAAPGCGDDSNPESCDSGGLEGEQARVYCDLWTLVDEAAISEHQKGEMFRCLDDEGAAERAELLEQFSQMTDEQLAATLTSRTDGCAECDYDVPDDDCDAH